MMDELDINDFERRIIALEKRITDLEASQKELDKKSPWMPDYLNIQHLHPFPKLKTVCSKCGIDFSIITGYSCGNPDCPMQPIISYTTNGDI
jgi:hypothetical protein